VFWGGGCNEALNYIKQWPKKQIAQQTQFASARKQLPVYVLAHMHSESASNMCVITWEECVCFGAQGKGVCV